MTRQRAFQIVLGVVGLLFLATILAVFMLHDEASQMMFSLYVTLGVFLLLAVRNPSANRSLIAFAGWSSLAHAGVMAVQSWHDVAERHHLLSGTAAFATIGIVLLVLQPAKTADAARVSD